MVEGADGMDLVSEQAVAGRRLDWRVGWRRLGKVHPNFLLGSVLMLFIVVASVAPHLLETYNPLAANFSAANQGPSLTHWMGTDRLGRDVYSRVVQGARVSLLMGIVPVVIGVSIGGLLGLIGGYFRRLGDLVIMRLMDMMMAFPALILALLLVAVLGTRSSAGTTGAAMVAIGIAFLPTFARVMYGNVLAVSSETYVDAARCIGCSHERMMMRHILPNAVSPMIVLGSLNVAIAILAGAALSFLGLGATPPTIDWGTMIANGRQVLETAWWISTFPGLVMMLTVLGVNLIGDGLRDVLDPRRRRS